MGRNPPGRVAATLAGRRQRRLRRGPSASTRRIRSGPIAERAGAERPPARDAEVARIQRRRPSASTLTLPSKRLDTSAVLAIERQRRWILGTIADERLAHAVLRTMRSRSRLPPRTAEGDVEIAVAIVGRTVDVMHAPMSGVPISTNADSRRYRRRARGCPPRGPRDEDRQRRRSTPRRGATLGFEAIRQQLASEGVPVTVVDLAISGGPPSTARSCPAPWPTGPRRATSRASCCPTTRRWTVSPPS